jgi:hypothetical protein
LRVEQSAGVTESDPAVAATWKLPPALHIDVSAVRSPDGLLLTATVHNTGTAPADWVYLTGGAAGGTNPMGVTVRGVATKPMNAPPIEVYPAPKAMRMPAGAEIRYRVSRCQSDYASPWPAQLDIDWSVEGWGDARKTGTLRL